MSLFSGMNASASGLTAQRVRLDLIANNIANVETTHTARTTAAGNPIPYQRQLAVFQAREAGSNSFAASYAGALRRQGITSTDNLGVRVREIVNDPKDFALDYDPDSPDAAQVTEEGIPEGYVRYPNVTLVEEFVDMISAVRSYQANVTALNASKSLASAALDIGKG